MKKLFVIVILIVGLFFTSCGGVLDISSFPKYPENDSFDSIEETLTWLQENGHANPEDSFVKNLSGMED